MADKFDEQIEELHEKLKGIPRMTPWSEIAIGSVYHVPKLGVLKRMNIIIEEKDDTKGTYRVLGDSKEDTHPIHSTSIYARILVKPKGF